jgi:hypothetical protein
LVLTGEVEKMRKFVNSKMRKWQEEGKRRREYPISNIQHSISNDEGKTGVPLRHAVRATSPNLGEECFGSNGGRWINTGRADT